MAHLEEHEGGVDPFIDERLLMLRVERMSLEQIDEVLRLIGVEADGRHGWRKEIDSAHLR